MQSQNVRPDIASFNVNLRRVQPRFPPELWNVHEATHNNDAGTNNQCDG